MFGQFVLDPILYAVHEIIHVVAMDQQRAQLWVSAIPPGVDHHVARGCCGDRRAMSNSDQVERKIDSTGNAGRGDHPIIDGEEHVAYYLCRWMGPCELILQLVVGGASTVIEKSRLSEIEGAGANTGYGPT